MNRKITIMFTVEDEDYKDYESELEMFLEAIPASSEITVLED